MQYFQDGELNFSLESNIPTPHKPIATHLGRVIFLNRIIVQGMDKGLWLHWCDPRDQGRKNALKYGHFMAPNQTLQEVLHEVYQTIEASIELESLGDPLGLGFDSDRASYQGAWCNEAS